MDPVKAKARWASQRRVPRASRACETCRSRKTKCDQAQPCSYCAYHSFDCIYRTSSGRGPARGSVSEKKRVFRSSHQNQDKAARPSPWPGACQSNTETNTHSREAVIPGPSYHLLGETIRRSDSAERNPATSDILTASSIQNDETPTVHSEIGDAESRDGLSGVNIHTKGTEFYGNSSNLAFLGNLYTRAKNQADTRAFECPATGSYTTAATNRSQPLSPATVTGVRPLSSKAQLSIVNLLYNADYTGQPSPQSLNSVECAAKSSPSFTAGQDDAGAVNSAQDISLPAVFFNLSNTARLEIEKIFIGSYFTNKHYIHPVLTKGSFMRRCEREAWPNSKRTALFRGAVKFAGLYFAVVALGAINASPNETALLDHFCQQLEDADKTVPPNTRFSALDFAKFYFDIAKQALGDLFESSCLETAQALFLMSVFRQNSLQPHSCYMYSGMAVRTAAAIGLASSMSSLHLPMRMEAKRTWWCIYSHEIEMCCSSGRLDSMKDLRYYQVSLPKLKVNVGSLEPDAEDNDIAMIPTMVSLAQIMSEASHQLYHSTQRSMGEKSRLAMILDARLLDWKANIPSFLNPDATTLNDPEWAFKQKLVLRLRYYNTRILIHRPFLVAATSNTHSDEFRHHLHICLEAARNSITMQYESFMHRIYIRTWWYNTTYALYGSMILLHLILSNYPDLPDDELLEDVEKSLQIFESMDDIVVARRCAEMLREVLEVAGTCLLRRRRGENGGVVDRRGSGLAVTSSSSGAGIDAASGAKAKGCGSSDGCTPPGTGTGTASFACGGSSSTSRASLASLDVDALAYGSSGAPALPLENMITSEGLDDRSTEEDFFFSLFSQDPSQPPDQTRTEMLANLVDPSILEDFAFGQEMSFF